MTTPATRSVDGFVASLIEQLPPLPPGAPVGVVAAKVGRKGRSVANACGGRNLTSGLLQELSARLKEEGFYVDRDLVHEVIKPDDRLLFSRRPLPMQPEFRLEKGLVDFVVKMVEERRAPFTDLRVLGTEFRLQRGAMRMDLLCAERRSSGTGSLVAFEFKKGRSPKEMLIELERYLDQLPYEPNFLGRRVRGVLVTSGEEPTMRRAVEKSNHQIDWYRYDVSFLPVATSRQG